MEKILLSAYGLEEYYFYWVDIPFIISSKVDDCSLLYFANHRVQYHVMAIIRFSK